ncbi:MAG: N-ethylammeline chlorohydrolase, partial [Clostridia bacterium]|nr:N-ethylammeline chlorohydrolase [Clostridia bacterium]
MNTLIKNVHLSEEYGFGDTAVNVGVTDDKITYIGAESPKESYEKIIDGKGDLLFSGFYNSHCHAAMTLFR